MIIHLDRKVWRIALGTLAGALLLLTAYLVYRSLAGNYLPIFSDEYAYHLDAKNFWLYNRIDAATTLNENFSRYGDAGFHGFAYGILYGTIFKLLSLLGIEPSIMIANIFLVGTFLLFLVYTEISFENKLLLAIVFLSNFILIVYLPSAMTELFHYVFAFIVGYMLFLVYASGKRVYLISFIVLVMSLSFFRQSWIFALVGLFPLSRSLKAFVLYGIVFLFGLFLVLLDIKLFHAPYPFGFFQQLSSVLQNESLGQGLSLVYHYFLKNIDNYFLAERYEEVRFVFYFKYLFVALLLYAFYCSLRYRTRVILAATLIAFTVFFALLTLYDTYDWREVRMLTAPFMILMVVLILERRYLPVFAVIAFQLITLPMTLHSQERINDRRAAMGALVEEYRPMYDSFLELGNYVGSIDKKRVLILLTPKLFSLDSSPIFYQLPLHLGGKDIQYSFAFGSKIDMSAPKSDLYISDKAERYDNMELLGKNRYYYYYRIIKRK